MKQAWGLLALLLAAAPATAADVALITPERVAEMRGMLLKPVTLISLAAQNQRHQALTQEQIDGLDKRWRAETKAAEQPLVAQLLGSPLSTYLNRIQARAGGLYTEIFVMDARGLNVGQSSVTSDYWQGDEAKWQKTFLAGADAVFVDAPELHEASGTWRVQVNVTLADPETRKPAGAATIEVNLTELERRAALAQGATR